MRGQNKRGHDCDEANRTIGHAPDPAWCIRPVVDPQRGGGDYGRYYNANNGRGQLALRAGLFGGLGRVRATEQGVARQPFGDRCANQI